MSKNGLRKFAAGAARKTKKPPIRERGYDGLHVAVADYFRAVLPPEVVWLHIPNGEKRDKATAALLERMGVLAGAPDFLLLYGETSHALELKSGGGKLSPAQLEFMRRAEAQGCMTAAAYSVDEVEATLRRWGIPVRGTVTL